MSALALHGCLEGHDQAPEADRLISALPVRLTPKLHENTTKDRTSGTTNGFVVVVDRIALPSYRALRYFLCAFSCRFQPHHCISY